MAIVTNIHGTKTALTVTGFATLASGTYIVSNTLSLVTGGKTDIDCMIEVAAATTNTPTGNQQVLIFAQASFDGGTSWQGGPTSGTSASDEPVLTFLGALAIRTSTTVHRRPFSIAAAYGGVCPPTVRIVLRNDLGVALTSGTLHSIRITGDIT